MKNPGVYKIVNVVTGQEYYGSSKNMHKRKGEHFNRLKAGKHINSKLQRSFNKYGIDAFAFSVVSITDDYVVEEQKILDTLNPYFNICKVSNDLTSIPRTKEWADKIANAIRGRRLSLEHRKKLSISHIGKVPSNKGVPCSTEKRLKISASKIGSIPWNKGVKTGRNEKQIAAITGRKHTEEHKNKKRKPINQIDKITGVIIKTWASSEAAGTNLKINIGNISSCCTGNRKSAGGYIWETASR